MGVKKRKFWVIYPTPLTQNGPNPQTKDFKHSNDVMIVHLHDDCDDDYTYTITL